MKDPLNFQLTISRKQFILKISIDCHMRFIALTIILMLIAGIIGFTAGNLKANNKSIPQLAQSIQTPNKENNSVFQSQSASITGSVTAVSGNMLTITSQNNQTAQFEASEKMVVFTLDTEPTLASPSAEVESVQLNKIALIQLEMQDGKYKIVSIGYLPVNLPTPPATTSSQR